MHPNPQRIRSILTSTNDETRDVYAAGPWNKQPMTRTRRLVLRILGDGRYWVGYQVHTGRWRPDWSDLPGGRGDLFNFQDAIQLFCETLSKESEHFASLGRDMADGEEFGQ